MNIEEIKKDVIKAIECDTETMPDYYYDMDMGNHIKTLATDIEYLLSIIEQAENDLSEIIDLLIGDRHGVAWERAHETYKLLRIGYK